MGWRWTSVLFVRLLEPRSPERERELQRERERERFPGQQLPPHPHPCIGVAHKVLAKIVKELGSFTHGVARLIAATGGGNQN